MRGFSEAEVPIFLQKSDIRQNKQTDFHDRFKGKIQKMGKEGALGVAKSAKKPIQPIADGSDSGDRSEAGYTKSSLWSGIKQ